jgi:hypothetical protein
MTGSGWLRFIAMSFFKDSLALVKIQRVRDTYIREEA